MRVNPRRRAAAARKECVKARWARMALLLAVGGCAKPAPPPPFRLYVRVESTDGQPLPAANVAGPGQPPVATNAEGRAMLVFAGVQGQMSEVSVTCPDGYQSPPQPIAVTLDRFADPTKVPEYTVRCSPVMRRIVVAVRAPNGPNLPVLCMNRVVARTDSAGAAHFALEVSPGAQFGVALDTQTRPDLLPPNPSTSFVATASDDVVLFDAAFEPKKDRRD